LLRHLARRFRQAEKQAPSKLLNVNQRAMSLTANCWFGLGVVTPRASPSSDLFVSQSYTTIERKSIAKWLNLDESR
jgi:hypothetical protein